MLKNGYYIISTYLYTYIYKSNTYLFIYESAHKSYTVATLQGPFEEYSIRIWLG